MRISGFALLALLILVGCDDGRHSPGVRIGPDGKSRYNNSVNARTEAETTIERAINGELAPSWRANVTIADEPRWSDDREEWLWPATAVRIELSGDPAVPPPLETPTITKAVLDYFADRLADPAKPVQVTVATVERPAVAAPAPLQPAVIPVAAPVASQMPTATGAPAPTAATPVAPTPTAAAATIEGQRYQVQAGDTLARISAVFYGSPKHWRLIVDANPGLVPEAMRVGQEIVIPTLPPAAP